LELEYGPLNIPLLLFQWVKLTGGGIRKDQYGMTIVDLTKIGFKDEPFVSKMNHSSLPKMCIKFSMSMI
jgi:hypothetical protein